MGSIRQWAIMGIIVVPCVYLVKDVVAYGGITPDSLWRFVLGIPFNALFGVLLYFLVWPFFHFARWLWGSND